MDEPEPDATAADSGFSPVVARQATESNALNLGELSLVGVFGAAGSRRALLRLANGRFQTVEVGDRVDGGQVVAISTSQLSYAKSGRTLVLHLLAGN
jgi:Tfp pilus assembly protein PilP